MIRKIMAYFGLAEEQIIEREEQPEEEIEPTPVQQFKSKGKVVSLHQNVAQKMILSEPRSYEEARDVADHLKARKPVIVNLQLLQKEQAKRLVDFLSGTIYAINGNIQKIGKNIFLCVPEHIDVQGTITDILSQQKGNFDGYED